MKSASHVVKTSARKTHRPLHLGAAYTLCGKPITERMEITANPTCKTCRAALSHEARTTKTALAGAMPS